MILIPYFKKCHTCKLTKIITDFYYSAHTHKIYGKYSYWSSICKKCDKKRRNNFYYAVEKDGVRKTKEWQKSNRIRCHLYGPKRNKLKTREKNRKWYDQNKEGYNTARRKERRENSEKFKERDHFYWLRNKEKIYRHQAERRHANPLAMSASSAIWRCLKGNKQGRHWENLVGYTLMDLKKHLEDQFKPGMNWQNYGEWHLDHIKPQSLFKFTHPEDSEFLECWRLKNLQPLWARENKSKGAKFLI
jgi:hypothetical protein